MLDHFLVPGQTYRGEESTADITIGMGFAGHMLIELIQPLDNNPSVYRETIALRGYGFHHFGIACADVDADSLAYQRRGYHEAFRAAVPTGGEVVYLDNGSGPQWGFLELLPVTPGMDETFTRFWKASLRLGRERTRSARSSKTRILLRMIAPTLRRGDGYQTWLVLLLSLNFGILFFDRQAANFLMPSIAARTAPERHPGRPAVVGPLADLGAVGPSPSARCRTSSAAASRS